MSDVEPATRCVSEPLVTRHQARGPYAALSYCWGAVKSLCMTKHNVSRFSVLIDHSEIPPTIADAMKVASKLGFDYIWVDRLCIDQQDAKDWNYHASIMDTIYEDADVVISAVTPASADHGFLGDITKDWRRAYHQYHQVPRIDTSEASHQIVFRERPRPSSAPNPLDLRGWTMQEQLIATRRIRFEAAEVTWACTTMECRESQPYAEIPPSLSLTGGISSDLGYRQWQDLVWEYTRRDLSFVEDRLPALSGIAARFAKRLDDVYLAGLWRKHLEHGLSWYRTYKPDVRDHCAISGAPTWSWTSVPGSIEPGFTVSQPPKEQYDQGGIRVLNVKCQPATENPFGSVIWPAKLTVRAVSMDAMMIGRDTGQASATYGLLLGTSTDTMRRLGQAPDAKDLFWLWQDCALVIEPFEELAEHSEATCTRRRWARRTADHKTWATPASGCSAPVKLLLPLDFMSRSELYLTVLSEVGQTMCFQRLGLSYWNCYRYTQQVRQTIEQKSSIRELTMI